MAGSTRTMRLRNKLKVGEGVLATFNFLKSARTSQLLANTGLDAVIVDCEHGNINDSEMHDMVSAIAGAKASPIVRVRGSTMPVVKRALDTGAHGIIIPMMNNAAQAREVVSSAKFPPLGVRGQSGPFACYEFGLATPVEYVAAANDLIVVMVQIETREGLRNVEEICQVDGVDLLLIGPNDLALALLGYAPARSHEKIFQDAVDRILHTAKKHGKKAGLVVRDGDGARAARDKGFDFIALSADGRALQGWYAAELAKL